MLSSVSFKLWADPRNRSIGLVTRALEESADAPGTRKVPFKLADRVAYRAAIKGARVRVRADVAEPQDVPLAELTATQARVNDERVAQHLDQQLYAEGTRAPGHGGLVDFPIVVRLNGQLYLHDGHHRAAAAYARGDRSIRARVVDVDQIKADAAK